MTTTQPTQPEISIIIPARNEEASLASCLESLVGQTAVSFEIIVVNDHSADRTREIASSFPNVKVMDADPLPPGWTGKNNALIAGAAKARGKWLLFTDADTVHRPSSLARALNEAKVGHAALLSYSPEQVVSGFCQRAVMPVIFAELAAHYRPSEVSDPKSPAAAANGQYILISREAYDAVGGHAVVADKILEDVELARAVKRSDRKILFRFGGDEVRTHMYRNFSQLREGWTKNLAILFPSPARLAFWRLSEFLALVLSLALLIFFVASRQFLIALLFLMGPVFTFRRIARAHFPWTSNVLALFGLPLFSYMLLRSKLSHQRGRVAWKGREYAATERPQNLVSDHLPEDCPKTLMKRLPFVFLCSLLACAVQARAMSAAGRRISVTALALQSSITEEPQFTNTVIEPGAGLGPLKLGDSRPQALTLFPKKDIDQQWDDPCGTTIDWVDVTNPMGRGEVFIRLKKGKIFQIESSTTRFHTADGVTVFDPPEKVAAAYKDMRAWVLLNPPSPSLGSRPLVFWIDKKKGIAFTFAYDPSHHKRYVYKIIVFEPNKEFCPELEKTSSPKWQELNPYSTEPSRELSPEP